MNVTSVSQLPTDQRPNTLTPTIGTSPPIRRNVALVTIFILIIMISTGASLWWFATANLTGNQLISTRFDAIKIALSVGAGLGGGLALYLAWRRQQSTEIGLRQKDRDQDHQEHVAETNATDSRERRITDLYTKASDQLGAEKAAVRLAGLYALERLGQDYEVQRQTVVFVLCAYLRMPYTRPEEPSTNANSDEFDSYRERLQEQEVRATAQRILHRHLIPVTDNWWDVTTINLAGAELTLVDFSSTDLRKANFDRANLAGANFTDANLARSRLHRANLTEATLRDTDLRAANLTYATVMLADLSCADLRESTLHEADFTHAHLVHAKLAGTDLNHVELTPEQLNDANLQ